MRFLHARFRVRLLASLLTLSISPAAFAQSPSADDRASIEALVPDAEFINILGMVMPDAQAMRARHHEIFTGVFAGSRHHGVLRSLRLLTPEIALADVDIEVTGFRALPPGARESAPGVLRTRMRHVLKKLDGRWWIAASQNTAVAPAP